jgi:hypothetical protein
MKRYLACILIPLLVSVLSIFTPRSDVAAQTVQTVGKDSINLTITSSFAPAKLMIQDSRNAIDLTSVVQENTNANTQIATTLNEALGVLVKELAERRNASWMSRIRIATGASDSQINYIIHKKKVFDMIFYTIFLAFIGYSYYAINRGATFAKTINPQEFTIKTIANVFILGLLLLAYIVSNLLVNYDYQQLIVPIINSPPG